MGPHPGDHDPPQRLVGFAVAAAVEPVPAGDLAGGGRDRGDATQVRRRAFAAQPLRVIPGSDQQQRGGIRAGAVPGEQARRAGGDQRADQLFQAVQLGVQELHAATQLAQRDPGRIAGHITRPGGQRRDRGCQRGRGMPGEPGPQLIRAGHEQRPGLIDRLGPLMAGAALGHHQRPDRLHRPVAAPRRPRRSPGLSGPGRADRIQRIGLALPGPVLPVRAIHLDHPHAGRRPVAGQARP